LERETVVDESSSYILPTFVDPSFGNVSIKDDSWSDHKTKPPTHKNANLLPKPSRRCPRPSPEEEQEYIKYKKEWKEKQELKQKSFKAEKENVYVLCTGKRTN
jgi:hypothetical protein